MDSVITWLICQISILTITVESHIFEVLGTRDFILKY